MMLDIDRMIRPNVEAMAPYKPIAPFDVLSAQLGIPEDEIVKLDANENPYGPSPAIYDAIAGARLHIYPDPQARYLREALADFTGVPVDYLMAGSGADELIDLLFRAFISPGDVIINCPPTFAMYTFDGELNAARLRDVPRREDFSLDVDAIESAVHEEPRAKLLALCTPNNPTGQLIAPEALDRLLALPVLLLLDEAYIEFSGRASAVTRVPETPNLVVLRTFSKWAGLAGLRVGYGAFPQAIIKHLWKIKQPYNVNVAAQMAATASLGDVARLKANVQRIVAERDRMFAALQTIAYLRPQPTDANFVLCGVEGRDALALQKALAARGVLVRHYDKPGLSNYLRISTGRPHETDKLIAVLKELEA